MKDKTLLKIAFSCSLLGIILILFITENIEIKKSDILEITNDKLDKMVAISGKITRLTDTPDVLIMDIEDDTGEIVTVAFKEGEVNLKQGDQVKVEGKVTEYQGELEVQAETIRKQII